MMSDAEERKRLMKLKKRMSQKRPKFVRFESWRYKRLKDHWRRPKGVDNKMRFNLKGWPKSVNVGWGSPKAVRGLHPSGVEEVMVYNVGDLSIIDPETQVARIGGGVGKRKRSSIMAEAVERDIKVLNATRYESEIEEEEIEEELVEEDIEETAAEEIGEAADSDEEEEEEK
jgi:large subunit ribosomal protein L32e